MTTADPDAISRLLSVIDLTSLSPGDDVASTRGLAARARTPFGDVAALCVWPRHVAAARLALGSGAIPICTVTNFPSGDLDPAAASAETAWAVSAGAEEIDVVFPYRALLAGDRRVGVELVRGCRAAAGPRVLKVILETGELAEPDLIRAASEAAIEGGADFLKTSTGKTPVGATTTAAATMIEVIAGARDQGVIVGFKASGGVRSVGVALSYMTQFEERFGSAAAVASQFRIGASTLLTDVLDLLCRSSRSAAP